MDPLDAPRKCNIHWSTELYWVLSGKETQLLFYCQFQADKVVRNWWRRWHEKVLLYQFYTQVEALKRAATLSCWAGHMQWAWWSGKEQLSPCVALLPKHLKYTGACKTDGKKHIFDKFALRNYWFYSSWALQVWEFMANSNLSPQIRMRTHTDNQCSSSQDDQCFPTCTNCNSDKAAEVFDICHDLWMFKVYSDTFSM